MTPRQKRNIKLVKTAASELRWAGYSAKADHQMVQVVISGISDRELEKLQELYAVCLIAN